MSSPRHHFEVERVKGAAISKAEWMHCVESSECGSIYAYPDFLDAALPGWEGLILRERGIIKGVWPLWIKKKLGISHALQPAFVRYMGPTLAGPSAGMEQRHWYGFVHEAIQALTIALPKEIQALSYFLHPNFTYGLPFLTNGYRLGTRFTYVISPGHQWPKSILRKIREAKAAELASTSMAWEDVKELIKLNLIAKREIVPMNVQPRLERIANCREISDHVSVRGVYDNKGTPLAFAISLMDRNAVYNLAAGINPKYRDSPAFSLLQAERAATAEEKNCILDFQGSMLPGVESAIRCYGGTAKPHFEITRGRLSRLI